VREVVIVRLARHEVRGCISAQVRDAELHKGVRSGARQFEPAEFVGEHAIEATPVTLLVRKVLKGAF